MRRGIYVASKAIHADIWLAIRASGVPIISTWIDEAGVGQTKSFVDLWTRCIWEAANCHALILYVEPGEVLKGALVEVGAALASGAKVFVVGDPPGSFSSHPLVTKCSVLHEAVTLATEVASS